MLHRVSLALALAGITAAAGAQTVTVNSGGGADHTTITAALAAVVANPTTPDIINITGVGPYNESFVIDSSVSIVGFGVRPTIITPGVAGDSVTSLNGRGIAVTTHTATPGAISVRLENMNIIPANATVTRGIYSNNNTAGATADEMDIELVDVLVTGNNGSGVPVTTDGLNSYDYSTNPGSFTFTDDALFFAGMVDVTMTRTIASNGKGSASPDGLVFNPDTPHALTVNEGCRFTYMNRLGIQVAADGTTLRMNGTAANPILILGNDLNSTNPAFGIWHDNEGTASNDYVLSYVYVLNNANAGITTAFADPGQGSPAVTADHLVIANNGDVGLGILVDALQPWLITDSTIVNNSTKPAATTPQVTIDSATDAINMTTTFRDTIIGGNAHTTSTNGENSVLIGDATGLVVFDHVDLVTVGAYLLSAPYVLGGTGVAPTETGVVNLDPNLKQINDATLSTFVDVQESGLATASSTASPLKGAGDFTPILAANAWNMYQ